MGSAAIGGLISRPAVGWALDSWGRKPTLVVGTVILSLGMGLIWFIQAPDAVPYAVRIVFGIGVGAAFTGYFTFAADIVPDERRTEGLALFGISGLVPLAINPIAARVGVSAADLRWFLPLMGVVILASLIPLLLVRERPMQKAQPPTLAAVLAAIKRPRLRPVWLATCTFAGIAKIFMVFATVAAEKRGVPIPADFWLTYAGGAVFVRAFGARLPDRVGPTRLVAPAIALDVTAAIILAYATTTSTLLIAGLLAGLGHGYCFPVLASLVVSRSPDALRGSALAMFTGLWEVTGLVLPPVFGLIADKTSDATMFMTAAAAAGAGMVAWLFAERRAQSA